MLAGMALAFAVGLPVQFAAAGLRRGTPLRALLAWLLAENRCAARDGAADVERILVVATRQIGDVLLTTPLIHAARRRWPQARIDVLAFAGTLGMLRGNPDVDELIESPARLGLARLARLLSRGSGAATTWRW